MYTSTGSSGLLLSQQFKLLSTMVSQQLCLLRTLLVKQGYFFPLDVKFILNRLGDGGEQAVWPQGGQQCANGFLPYR